LWLSNLQEEVLILFILLVIDYIDLNSFAERERGKEKEHKFADMRVKSRKE